ncbi:MAG TPA: SDR family NAD(P)-dependent oxidoreductase [Actinomycetota bacterium]|nr:SDR family NAD(P)-dependent oxidoreductase [Actinomycetota bacterium]
MDSSEHARLCEGRVVIVTGAGRGIGRSHALEFARHGAKVVVNDLGAEVGGQGTSSSPATSVVNEIRDSGGEAVANLDDVSDWEGAHRLVQDAVDNFGRLDVLVNNAGILRTGPIDEFGEDDWDQVIKVHLKGTFCPTRAAAAHWRERAADDGPTEARVICTTSIGGLYPAPMYAAYAAAKAGIAAFATTAAVELADCGVTVNAIAPRALTRMSQGTPGGFDPDQVASGAVEKYAPENISPLVVWLGSRESAGVSGRVFEVGGNWIRLALGWSKGPSASTEGGGGPDGLGPLVSEILRSADSA